MKRYIFLLLLLGSRIIYANNNITLDVAPGEIQKVEIHNTQVSGSVVFSLSLNKPYWGDTPWAPYVYYSLAQDSGENSFRLSLFMPDKERGMFALVEYYKNGNPVFRNAILNSIPLGTKVDFSISWDSEGNITYSRMGGEPRTVKTHLRRLSESVGVSSSNATFYPKKPNN